MSRLADALGTAEHNARKPKRGLNAKTGLWTVLWLAILFVFITSEVLLLADYPLYHAYRLQLIADRYLLAPHAICGALALLSGPFQFSARLRQKYLRLHRVLGRIYVSAVFIAAPVAMVISWGRTLFPGTAFQASVWMVCTAMAFITARNRQIQHHRAWMMRSYAVTFTFISLRVLNIWPAYWNMSDAAIIYTIMAVTSASVLAVDIGLSGRELVTSRR